MALGSNHVTNSTADDFIPELWSDEIIGAYKASLILANHVTRINHEGKKGDTFHIPVPERGAANIKAASTQVTLNAPASATKTVLIDKHYEYSRLIEDITALQAMDSLRKHLTDDAGYALGKQIDQDLFLLAILLNSGSTTNDWASAVLGSDGSTSYADASDNAAALTDVGIRRMIQTLDDADVPMMGRFMMIPPVEKNNMTGISRFTEQAFVGDGNAIRNGYIANVYGVPVYVTSNCPWIHSNSVTNTVSTTFSSASPTGASYVDALGRTIDWSTSSPTDSKARVGMLVHKDAFALAEQQSIRSQAAYKLEYLGNLLVSDCVYGVSNLRTDAGVSFVVPS